jgi:hypothetical protein
MQTIVIEGDASALLSAQQAQVAEWNRILGQ